MHSETIDIKRIGQFPLVYGVRRMALQLRVREFGRVGHLDVLQVAGGWLPTTARDLIAGLHRFIELELKPGLAESERESSMSNTVRLDQLAALDLSFSMPRSVSQASSRS